MNRNALPLLGATVLIAACNGIVGNDRVSLWSPDGGGQDATSSDGSGDGTGSSGVVSADGSNGDSTVGDAESSGSGSGSGSGSESGSEGGVDADSGSGSGSSGGGDSGLDASGSSSGADSGSSNGTDSGSGGATDSGSSSGVDSGSDAGSSSDADAGADSGMDAGSAGGSDSGADSGTAAPPSCQSSGAGLTNCGSGSESCCTSLEVSGGTYYRTYANSGSGPTGEADPATVSDLRLDKYLVTVGRFRQFVNAVLPPDGGAGWLPPAGSGKHSHLNGGLGLVAGPNVDAGRTYEPGWVASDNGNIAPTNANLACASTYDTWTNTAGSQENLPINCVNWYEAAAFCIWDGGFLPSEAEWEYAAAGGNQQREYPWGSTGPGTANQYAIYNYYYTGNSTYIAPVGTATLGAGLWGQLDQGGEVWEWNLDWYATYVNPCTDCAYLTVASDRMARGGNFNGPSSFMLPPSRDVHGPPATRNGSIGLRCARTP